MPDEEVVNSTSVTSRRRRDAHLSGDDVIRVRIAVEDEDDNGPTFGGGTDGVTATRIVEGVLATSRPGTEITQIRAGDADSYANNRYSLRDDVFIDGDNDRKSVAYAFVIDALSGTTHNNSKLNFITDRYDALDTGL